MCCVRVYILFIVLRKWGHQINWGTSDQWLLYINCLGYEPHRLHTTDHKEAIQCVQNKIKWWFFPLSFTDLSWLDCYLFYIHCIHLYLIHIFRFYLYCSFQENIRCMPGYYEKKSETLYNDNVEIKYFWNNSKDKNKTSKQRHFMDSSILFLMSVSGHFTLFLTQFLGYI